MPIAEDVQLPGDYLDQYQSIIGIAGIDRSCIAHSC
jgi:hypothetical protein